MVIFLVSRINSAASSPFLDYDPIDILLGTKKEGNSVGCTLPSLVCFKLPYRFFMLDNIAFTSEIPGGGTKNVNVQQFNFFFSHVHFSSLSWIFNKCGDQT